MAKVVICTTPTFTLTLPAGTDLSQAAHIAFSLWQEYFSLDKEDEGITVDSSNHNVVTVHLTQAETLNFSPNEKAYVQLNWSYNDGSRGNSKIYEVDVENNLYKKVM